MKCKVFGLKRVLEWNCNICGHHNTKSVCELCGFKPKDLVNAQSPSLGPPVEIKLSLRAGGLQETLKALKQALEDQDWKQTTVDTPVSIKGGVSGVMNSIAALNEKTGNDLQDAFADLDSLMDKALEMVKLAESLRSKVGDRGELETLFLELGISQPVTKEATGDLYHQELAKQLADFLGPLFEKLKMQMMSLTDIYCFYNRARGVSLVSPEDLHRATLEFEKLGLPYVLYEFESGLKAVQSKSLDKDEQTTKILNLMSQDSGLTAVSLAKKLQMSIALSQELLNMLEKNGLVCRDDSIEGLLYYPNLFLSLGLT
ncbi:EAP30/Vps36 family-domain-containing protein [Gorgonomyces haynaldii]|nr:EAP30/Vps36 family-domain-containing protein [Gorgonomyces haynaldii]